MHSRLIIFTDASWKTGSTYAGYFILYANGAIDWGAKLLKVMMSCSEAEIGAGSIAGKRIVYVRNLHGEIFALGKMRRRRVAEWERLELGLERRAREELRARVEIDAVHILGELQDHEVEAVILA